MTRVLPPTLAPVVEALELDAPHVVTTATLRAMLEDAGVRTDPYVAINRLASHGWLLPTGVHGVWEFAPAAHGGPIGHGDPFLTLRAQLALVPDLDVRITLESALWRLGLADRSPDRHIVAVPDKASATTALRADYTITWFRSHLRPARVGGLPVASAETILVQLAETPTAVGNWGLILDCLSDLVAASDPQLIATETTGRPNATLVRLAYLASPFDAQLAASLPIEDKGTVWFGPRGTVRRRDPRWNVADTVLPRSPVEAAR